MQDINHKHELRDKDSTLLEIIVHRCTGELRNAKGHSIKYLTERKTAALEILNERKIQALLDNTRPMQEIDRESLGKKIKMIK